MIRWILPLVLMLAACGVDGPPIPPNEVDANTEDEDDRLGSPRTQVLISGNAVAGIRREG